MISNIFPKDWHRSKIKYKAVINGCILAETTSHDYALRYIDIGNISSDGEMRSC